MSGKTLWSCTLIFLLIWAVVDLPTLLRPRQGRRTERWVVGLLAGLSLYVAVSWSLELPWPNWSDISSTLLGPVGRVVLAPPEE